MAADHAASGGLVRDELYLLFLSAVFSGGAGGFILDVYKRQEYLCQRLGSCLYL